jgi:hypothetical protein
MNVHHRLALVGAALLLLTSGVLAQTTTPCDYTDEHCFDVSFSGIVCHIRGVRTGATDCSKPHDVTRAIILQGALVGGMRHQPILILPKNVNQKELNKATGERVHCDVNNCWVLITNFDMRVRGSSDCQPPNPTAYFDDLAPHLRDDGHIAGGDLKDSVTNGAFTFADVAGTFEMDQDGYLDACAFVNGGVFKDANGSTLGSCREFADEVFWRGSTTSPAILEIRSRVTSGWEQVHMNDKGALWVRIETVSSARRTSDHFILNAKLLKKGVLPTIDPCDVVSPTHLGCYTARIDVPGCSNSTFP